MYKRQVFKGVNRHEWNCNTARTLTLEDMEADVKALKKANVNAVRASHYPNDPRWYDPVSYTHLLVRTRQILFAGAPLTNAGPDSLLKGPTGAFAACGDRKTAKHPWKGNF